MGGSLPCISLLPSTASSSWNSQSRPMGSVPSQSYKRVGRSCRPERVSAGRLPSGFRSKPQCASQLRRSHWRYGLVGTGIAMESDDTADLRGRQSPALARQRFPPTSWQHRQGDLTASRLSYSFPHHAYELPPATCFPRQVALFFSSRCHGPDCGSIE